MRPRIGREIGLALIVGAVLALTHAGCLTPINPGPGPDPQPDGKAPFPADKLHVLLVHETTAATKLTADQRTILFSADMREFLKQTCPETGSTDTFRIYDADTPMSNDAEVWQKAMAVPRQSLPWLTASNGKTGVSVPLDMTPSEFKAIISRLKG